MLDRVKRSYMVNTDKKSGYIFLTLYLVVHTIGHGMNFYHFTTQSATDLTCLFRNDFHRYV